MSVCVYRNHHIDSTRWSRFPWRDDDIVICTYGKSGTTWLQQILAQIIYKGRDDLHIHSLSPWWDMVVFPIEDVVKMVEEIKDRRFIKTHLPYFAFPPPPKQQKVVYVARDGRDAIWSFHNHQESAQQLWYDVLNNAPDRVGPPIERPKEKIEYFKDFLYGVEGKRGTVDPDMGFDPFGEGYPLWPFFPHIKSWYDAAQTNKNIYLLHFNDLKKDLKGEIRKLAQFLEIPLENEEKIFEHCSFEWMKNNGNLVVPANGAFWKDGTSSFIYKGTNERWKEVLPKELSDEYERIAEERLGKECAEWLKNGKTKEH
eukprot:TRINITY_DN6100_c0_g1_i1.p1 TRINITY_DN6100_c0_g1~~TRINITY_DN6100_c0_g1_i1.p1  ORF type:complete len:323 (-),score=76.81 TRINITY_DN6100_c0_g1_i1:47-985(-)